ncbi:serine hydrolase [Bradyrhizobium diazoefficiens]|uniref:serine hydrolase n=1 Tax=Bradyrhizobium diazoefficiens TaxID=1355477 RepID=UPI00190E5589|nr:serine hydrolase [Bradyrhizobium diazoefficiens]MBK3662780.1 serine hydrolase [Bradyrhizobium diazoefficiens]
MSSLRDATSQQAKIAWRAEKSTPTASCIKLQILIALLSEVEKGNQSLDQTISVKSSDLVGESGVLKHLSPGITMPLRDVATLMIILSDNSATNIVVDLIGLDTINRVIAETNLSSTRLVNRLDFEKIGDDPTKFAVSAANDFLTTLIAIAKGQLISVRASQTIYEIMSRQHYLDLLPRKLPYNPYARDRGTELELAVAGKTGFFSGFRGDAVIVERLGVKVAMTAFATGADPSFRTDNAVARFMGELGEALFADLSAS